MKELNMPQFDQVKLEATLTLLERTRFATLRAELAELFGRESYEEVLARGDTRKLINIKRKLDEIIRFFEVHEKYQGNTWQPIDEFRAVPDGNHIVLATTLPNEEIVTVGGDHSVNAWNRTTKEKQKLCDLPEDFIPCKIFVLGGRIVTIGRSIDSKKNGGFIYYIDPDTGGVFSRNYSFDTSSRIGGLSGVCLPSGEVIYDDGISVVRGYNYKKDEYRSFQLPNKSVQRALASTPGGQVVIGDSDGGIYLPDMASFRDQIIDADGVFREPNELNPEISAMTVAANGRYLVVGNWCGGLVRYDLADKDAPAVIFSGNHKMKRKNREEKRENFFREDFIISEYHIKDKILGQPKVKKPERNSMCVRVLLALPNGYVASGHEDGFVAIWDPESGACIDEFEVFDGSTVWSLALSPEGQLIVTSYSGEVKIFEPKVTSKARDKRGQLGQK